MEHILLTTNAVSVRREKRGGRDYLVAPMTMLVPGVLPGSDGPLFYPPDETAKNPEDWNGFPIVVYHPTRNGVPVSARDPDVYHSQEVGRVWYSHATPDRRLRGEAWFDVDATRRVDRRVLDALESGSQIELSTGLFVDKEPAPPGANYKGRSYTHVARNYKPDHLAILPDVKGACSLQDGCGVLVNAAYAPWQSLKDAVNDGWTPLSNAFCPTGKGGGIDPSCGSKGSRGQGKTAGKSSSPKLRAAESKVKTIQGRLNKAKDRVRTLSAELKTAKTDVQTIKAAVKQKLGPTKADGQAEKVGKSLLDLQQKWQSIAQREVSSGKSVRSKVPNPESAYAEIDRAVGKASWHKVAQAVGFKSKFKNVEEAKKAVRRRIYGRAGSTLRTLA